MSLIELDLALGDKPQRAPEEFKILAAGDNGTRKGIVVLFDEEAARSVITEYQRGGVELPIDYDHAMASESAPPSERKAAGWFTPEVRAGELWATKVRWTPAAQAAIEAREWRYVSLFGDIEALGKGKARLKRLRNVALVNLPATLNTLPLVAHEGSTKDNEMADTDKSPAPGASRSPIVVTLGARDEAEAIEKVANLQTTLSDVASTLKVEAKPDVIKGAIQALALKAEKADKLQAQLNELTAKAEADKKAGLIAKLSEDGKLPPALHEWAKSQSIESLTAFGEHAPVLAPAAKVESAKTEQNGVVTLSDEEKQAAALLGNSLEFLTQHKKASVRAA